MLDLESISYQAGGRRILSDVSVAFDRSKRSIILGANGAGKSLLLRLCHGLIAPTSGRIHWRAYGPRQVRQAMVFQRPVMLRRSALANVAHALALAGVAPRERTKRAHEALERVGLQRIAHRSARVLSGGEQQQVALARAWALQPDVLFLDEPTASLDPTAGREVESIIAAIHAAGTKIIMTTHNLAQARRLADEILFLAGGRLVEITPVEEFFIAPASREAAEFIRGELP